MKKKATRFVSDGHLLLFDSAAEFGYVHKQKQPFPQRSVASHILYQTSEAPGCMFHRLTSKHHAAAPHCVIHNQTRSQVNYQVQCSAKDLASIASLF